MDYILLVMLGEGLFYGGVWLEVVRRIVDRKLYLGCLYLKIAYIAFSLFLSFAP